MGTHLVLNECKLVDLLLIAALWKAIVWNLWGFILAHVWKRAHSIHVLTLAVLSATYCKFINIRYQRMPRFISIKLCNALLTLNAGRIQAAKRRLFVLRVRRRPATQLLQLYALRCWLV